MGRRAPWAVLVAAVSLCLATAGKTPAHPFTDETDPPPLTEECYQVGSIKLAEDQLVVMKVTNEDRLVVNPDSPSGRRRDSDGWRFGARNDVRLVLTFERAQPEAAGDEAEAAGTEAAEPEPELVVTTHDVDDPSAPFMTFRLDRRDRGGSGAAARQPLGVGGSVPSC